MSNSSRTQPWQVAVKRFHGVSAAVVVLGLSIGCRSVDNAQVDLMERELRHQENYIYELEDYLVDYSEKLRQCRCDDKPDSSAAVSPKKSLLDDSEPELVDEPSRLRARRPETMGADAPDSTVAPRELDREVQPPAVDEELPGPTDDAITPEEFDVPELEIGPTGAALRRRNDDLAVDASPRPLRETLKAGELNFPDPVDYLAEEPSPEDHGFDDQANRPGVQHDAPIALSQTLQLGEPGSRSAGKVDDGNADGSEPATRIPKSLQIRRVYADQVGPDVVPASLLVVVEAHNDAGEAIDVGGDVSLMVMSSDAPGSLQRLDRWDFKPEEAQAAWQASHLGRGLHLELPLKEHSLPSGSLELWARLVTADGDKLLTQLPLNRDQLATLDHETGQPNNQPSTAGVELAESTTARPTTADAATSADRREASSTAPTWRASTAAPPLGTGGFASTIEQSAGWSSSGQSHDSGPSPASPTDAAPAARVARSTWQPSVGSAPSEQRPASTEPGEKPWNPLR